MKSRRFHQYWLRPCFSPFMARGRFLRSRLHLPFIPLEMPILRGGRNKQWQKALEIESRSWMKNHVEADCIKMLNDFGSDARELKINDHGNEMDQD